MKRFILFCTIILTTLIHINSNAVKVNVKGRGGVVTQMPTTPADTPRTININFGRGQSSAQPAAQPEPQPAPEVLSESIQPIGSSNREKGTTPSQEDQPMSKKTLPQLSDDLEAGNLEPDESLLNKPKSDKLPIPTLDPIELPKPIRKAPPAPKGPHLEEHFDPSIFDEKTLPAPKGPHLEEHFDPSIFDEKTLPAPNAPADAFENNINAMRNNLNATIDAQMKKPLPSAPSQPNPLPKFVKLDNVYTAFPVGQHLYYMQRFDKKFKLNNLLITEILAQPNEELIKKNQEFNKMPYPEEKEDLNKYRENFNKRVNEVINYLKNKYMKDYPDFYKEALNLLREKGNNFFNEVTEKHRLFKTASGIPLKKSNPIKPASHSAPINRQPIPKKPVNKMSSNQMPRFPDLEDPNTFNMPNDALIQASKPASAQNIPWSTVLSISNPQTATIEQIDASLTAINSRLNEIVDNIKAIHIDPNDKATQAMKLANLQRLTRMAIVAKNAYEKGVSEINARSKKN